MTRWVVLKNGRPTPASGCSAVLFKVMVAFLAFLAVLAIFGKWRFPGQDRLDAAKCKGCGRYKIGKGSCSCGRG